MACGWGRGQWPGGRVALETSSDVWHLRIKVKVTKDSGVHACDDVLSCLLGPGTCTVGLSLSPSVAVGWDQGKDPFLRLGQGSAPVSGFHLGFDFGTWLRARVTGDC